MVRIVNSLAQAGHPGPASSSRRRTRGSTPLQINFTIVFHELVAYFVLEDNANYKHLQKVVETRFKVPQARQILYGWPNNIEPATQNTTFKELNLSGEVLLQLAVEGALDHRVEYELVEVNEGSGSSALDLDDDEAEVPTPPSIDAQIEGSPSSYLFALEDKKNGEVYNDVTFGPYQTVKEVKDMFGEIACIPSELQVWSGWPENATDDSLLEGIGLDRPIHALVLSELKHEAGTSSVEPYANAARSPSIVSLPGSNQNSESLLADVDEIMLFAPINSSASVEGNNNDLAGSAQGPSGAAVVSANQSRSMPVDQPDAPHALEKNAPTAASPSTPKVERARKSTSKGALRELQNMLKGKSSQNSNAEAINESSRGLLESPGTSQEYEAPSSSTQFKRTLSSSSIPSTPKKSKNDSLSQGSSRKSKECYLLKLLNDPDPKIAKFTQKLLDYLDPLSELSLRRTCKKTKEWVTRSTSVTPIDQEKWKKYRLTITGTDHRTFETAVNMSLPITRFVFDFDEFCFYDSSGAELFIAHLGFRVKDLRLKMFYMFQTPGEVAMLRSFVNLEQLTLDNLHETESEQLVSCPLNLYNLQVLKLNYEIKIPQQNSLVRPKSWDLTWGMLMDCQSLLYFRLPRLNENVANPLLTGEGIFAPLLDFIHLKSKTSGMSLEYLDLKHFNNTRSLYITRFVQLLSTCHLLDIKLKNVNALVVQEVFDDDVGFGDEQFKFCESIITLVNYCPFVENSPMRNVEKISIDVVPCVRDYTTMGKAYKDIFWPKLHTIHIKDSYKLSKDTMRWGNWQIIQEDLYGHNGTFHRTNVQNIRIDSPKLPYFLGEGVLPQKFMNLRKLEICSWFNSDRESVLNKRLWPIWIGLQLEELKIDKCPALNDNSFIGHTTNNDVEEVDEDSDSDTESSRTPVFLKLSPTLTKFTLGLDGVRKVTDQTFKKVLSKMRLKTFILLSTQPTKISEAALLKMLNGKFGETIERFPFDTWSTTKIDESRFRRIGSQFRSRC